MISTIYRLILAIQKQQLLQSRVCQASIQLSLADLELQQYYMQGTEKKESQIEQQKGENALDNLQNEDICLSKNSRSQQNSSIKKKQEIQKEDKQDDQVKAVPNNCEKKPERPQKQSIDHEQKKMLKQSNDPNQGNQLKKQLKDQGSIKANDDNIHKQIDEKQDNDKQFEGRVQLTHIKNSSNIANKYKNRSKKPSRLPSVLNESRKSSSSLMSQTKIQQSAGEDLAQNKGRGNQKQMTNENKNIDYEEQNKKLRSKNKFLMSQLRNISIRLNKQLSQRGLSANRGNSRANSTENISMKQIQNADKRCRIYKKQIQILKHKSSIFTEQRINFLTDKTQQLQKANSDLQQQKKSLKKENKNYEKIIAQIGDGDYLKTKQQNQKLRSQNRKLREQAKKQEQQQRLEKITAANEKNKSKKQQQQKQIKQKKAQQKEEKQINLLKSKSTRDDKKIQSLIGQNNNYKQKIDEYQKQLDEKNKQIQVLKQKIRSLKSLSKPKGKDRQKEQSEVDKQKAKEKSKIKSLKSQDEQKNLNSQQDQSKKVNKIQQQNANNQNKSQSKSDQQNSTHNLQSNNKSRASFKPRMKQKIKVEIQNNSRASFKSRTSSKVQSQKDRGQVQKLQSEKQKVEEKSKAKVKSQTEEKLQAKQQSKVEEKPKIEQKSKAEHRDHNESKYPKKIQKGQTHNQSYKWNHHAFSSKIKQVQVMPHPNGHIKCLNFRYQKGEPAKIEAGNYASFVCDENGQYIRQISGGFKGGVLQYIRLSTNKKRQSTFCKHQISEQCLNFAFTTNNNQYIGSIFGENMNESIIRIGCFIQYSKQK